MNGTATFILGVLCVLGGSLCLGQNYKCDWCVNGLGGGDMSSAAYRCGATAGQTASGQITSASHWALIGYWQSDLQVGVRETAERPSGIVEETRLYAPVPNPFSGAVAIRYSLAADGPASLAVHDVTGRIVRELVASGVKRGAYSVRWDGRDERGRALANGVYFCRLIADGQCRTGKLVLRR